MSLSGEVFLTLFYVFVLRIPLQFISTTNRGILPDVACQLRHPLAYAVLITTHIFIMDHLFYL